MLLRAIDSIRQGRLQHIYSKGKEGGEEEERKGGGGGAGGGRKAGIEVRRIREKKKKRRRSRGNGLGTMGEKKNKIEYREKRLESVSAKRDAEQDRHRKAEEQRWKVAV